MLISAGLWLAVVWLLKQTLPLGSPDLTHPLLLVLTATLLMPLTRWVIRRQMDPFELIYPITFSYFIYFVLAYLRTTEEPVSYYQFLSPHHVNLSILYVTMGLCTLFLGYYGPFAPSIVEKLPRTKLDLPQGRLEKIAYGCYLVGTAIRLFLLATGTHTWSTKIISEETLDMVPAGFVTNFAYLNNLALFGFMLAAPLVVSAGRNPTLQRIFWCVMLPGEFLWAFSQGHSSQIVPVLAAPLLAYNYMRRRVPLHWVALGGLVFVFIIFPVVQAYREIAIEYPIRLATLPQTLPQIARATLDSLIQSWQSAGFEPEAAQGFFHRVDGLALVASVLRYVDLNGFISGETLWQTPIVLVPTALLPDKYEHLAYGSELYGEVMGLSSTTSGIAIMQVGEFYLNFGVIGILLGMFLQGILYRCWHSYWLGQGTPLGVAFYLLGFRILTPIEYPISVGYGELLREMMLLSPLVWLAARSGGRPSTASGLPQGGVLLSRT